MARSASLQAVLKPKDLAVGVTVLIGLMKRAG